MMDNARSINIGWLALVIITFLFDEKLEQAKKLGAEFTVYYCKN